MSNLVDHARRELALFFPDRATDPEQNALHDSLLNAVVAFASYGGHSGTSAEVTIQALNDLLRFRNLSPLTDDPDEWLDHTHLGGSPLWQSRRNSEAFSADRGKTYTLNSDFRNDNDAPVHRTVHKEATNA